MLKDRYDNSLSTSSTAARDAYVAGCDLLLSAGAGTDAAFRQAIAADDRFALAHMALARTYQVQGRGPEAKAALVRARELADGLSEREKSHLHIFGLILEGQGAAAVEATRVHMKSWPRDAMVLAPSTSVFGLIGFSGKAGREQEQLDLLQPFVSAYGDDWWFLTVLAFAEIELQQNDIGGPRIQKALSLNPRNAHAAHILAHHYYEVGDRQAGLGFLKDWAKDYPRDGQLDCHVHWHIALWQMETGQDEEAWRTFDRGCMPGATWGPPLNVLTDCASFVFRSELAGGPRRAEHWQKLSAYAAQWFPRTGVAFADVHSALAHAMAGNGEKLQAIIADAKGPAADVVAPYARALGAFARGDWTTTIGEIQPHLAEHERIGGSRAQRDLIEYTLAGALLRSGRAEEARGLLASRRPHNVAAGLPLAGLH